MLNYQQLDDHKVRILALSVQQPLADQFVRLACGPGLDETNMLRCGERLVSFETLSGEPKLNPYWHRHVAEAAALILLARHLDVLSTEALKNIVRSLPLAQSVPPLHVLIMREPNERDFKLSCLECGQKLWVRDDDVGKNGRCPGCRQAFVIPSQIDYLRQRLALPVNTPVSFVESASEITAREAVEQLLAAIEQAAEENEPHIDEATMKRSTIRIQIQDIS